MPERPQPCRTRHLQLGQPGGLCRHRLRMRHSSAACTPPSCACPAPRPPGRMPVQLLCSASQSPSWYALSCFQCAMLPVLNPFHADFQTRAFCHVSRLILQNLLTEQASNAEAGGSPSCTRSPGARWQQHRAAEGETNKLGTISNSIVARCAVIVARRFLIRLKNCRHSCRDVFQVWLSATGPQGAAAGGGAGRRSYINTIGRLS